MSNIYLEVEGEKYEGFTDVMVNSSLENFCSSFAFSTTVKEKVSFLGKRTGKIQNDIKLQSKVRVLIDDIVVITGYVEDLNVDYDATNHTITYSGRDIGGDIVDSSIKQKTYKQRNFAVLLKMVLFENGFTTVRVINKAGNLYLESSETIKTEQGEKIFDFMDRYAKKLQVILKINEYGNLVIMRESDEVVKNMLINNLTSDNNILSANLNLTTKDRFNVVEVYSQSNNKTHTKKSISQKGIAEDKTIRKTRRIAIDLKTASNSPTLKALAQWNINLRRAKGSRYRCKVVDYYSERIQKILFLNVGYDKLWKPNTLVDIVDDIAQVKGTFLIQGVEFQKNVNGSFTTLDIVERGSFMDTKPSIYLKIVNSFADGLIA